jgi:hypothetical protein
MFMGGHFVSITGESVSIVASYDYCRVSVCGFGLL